MVMGAVGDIRNHLKRMPRTVRVGVVPGGLSEFITIQAAIDWCNTQAVPAPSAATPYTVEIWPGVYDEEITLATYVNLVGLGHELATLISINSVNPVITAGNVVCELTNIALINAGAGTCITVNNAGADVHLDDVRLSSAGADVILMTAGSLRIHIAHLEDGDITLQTAACILVLHHVDMENGDIDTAGAFAHSVTLRESTLGGATFDNLATGATTIIIEKCSGLTTLNDASLVGTVSIEGSDVGTLNKTGTSTWTIGDTHITTALRNTNATGDITVYGGVIFAVTDSTGSIVWYPNGDKGLEVITGMKIAHALAAAGANSIIKIGAGVYAENNLQLTANVDLIGADPEQCQIVANSAAQPILKAVTNVTLSNLTIGNTNAGNAAIRVNPGNTIIVRNCEIYGTGGGECLDLKGGSIEAHETHFSAGVIHLETAICTVRMDNCELDVDFNTSSAVAHVLTFIGCDFNGQDLVSAATGATTLSMRGCSNVGTVSNAGSGIFTILDSGVDTVTASSTGTFVITGGRVLACGGATASITWKTFGQQYEVIAGMVIQHAITAADTDTPAPSATNPYTLLIHPGIYDEAIIMANWVNLKGVGPKGSVVIYQDDVDVIRVVNNVELQNFTVRLGTITASRTFIREAGVPSTVRMTDLHFEVTAPGTDNIRVFQVAGASDFTIERCSFKIGGTGLSNSVNNGVGNGIFHLVENDFQWTNPNASHIFSSQAGTWTGKGNRWAGPCQMFWVTAGTFTFDNDAMICTSDWTSMTGITMTLRNCTIEAPVLVGNLGTIRMKNCSYRAIQRTGTGNIVDESAHLQDAPWHVDRWNWQAVLANAQVAVRGTPVDAGSGQVLLEVNTGGADFEAVEANPEVAGALGNEFTPARTPRFLTQIAVDVFHADARMFFGLRETLGNAVPAATEDHAGFIWNGANFIASSDDGGASQTTNLTTPTVNVHVQLEVIVFGGVTTVGWVEFYIDGVLVATHGTRIPVNVLDWQHLLESPGAGAAADIDVTIRPGGCVECPS